MIEFSVPTNIPSDIVEASNRVAKWFRNNYMSRWSCGGCADKMHYDALVATSRLVISSADDPEQHKIFLDQLDNLLR